MSKESRLTPLALAQALLNANLIETNHNLEEIFPWTVEDILWGRGKDDAWGRVARGVWEDAAGELTEVYDNLECFAQARAIAEGFDNYCDECLDRLVFPLSSWRQLVASKMQSRYSKKGAVRS